MSAEYDLIYSPLSPVYDEFLSEEEIEVIEREEDYQNEYNPE